MKRYLLQGVMVSVFILMEVGLWLYTLELVGRTRFLRQGTSVGNDVILGVYVASIIAVGISGLLVRKSTRSRRLAIVFFLISLLQLILFATMNVSGKVRMYEITESFRNAGGFSTVWA